MLGGKSIDLLTNTSYDLYKDRWLLPTGTIGFEKNNRESRIAIGTLGLTNNISIGDDGITMGASYVRMGDRNGYIT